MEFFKESWRNFEWFEDLERKDFENTFGNFYEIYAKIWMNFSSAFPLKVGYKGTFWYQLWATYLM